MPDKIKERRKSKRSHDPLALLEAIMRLEVGPVRVEKKRLIAPYCVIRGKKRSSFDLIYRYDEDVFDPAGQTSVNLAALIAAQVSFNYGLFSKEIIFHGDFNAVDQRFIRDVIGNTAREIYVKKFLQPNPFLIGPVASLPVVKKDDYVRAEIIFSSERGSEESVRRANTLSDENAEQKTIAAKKWDVDPSRYAVLSSGGKDSLLSFGLLHEIGKEIHPIFINESGRHWFTALNGYRYLAANHAETTRVWTNADRLFAWMLRHLPFIRQDFSRIRSDEYPIRLWTVAVFLFGALPLMRKRKIGRLVIGDEYDTTSRQSFKGITHYNGLYDQSRYFDNACTRYFHQKGWQISQFSILRQLSELLIEKTLVERYPNLQQQQVSCHATHVRGDRVYPCGRCEKCRRIVGMLRALDADPTMCGYNKEQIMHCMKDLAGRGVHQESAGAQHLSYLLQKKGFITDPDRKVMKGRLEIMKLRFDPEKSPMEGIPVDLRKPLSTILLKHAMGAVKRQGRLWIDFDPLRDAALTTPYPFDSPSGGYAMPKKKKKKASPGDASYLLEELTWPEAQIRFKEVDVALLPVGSIEQHGPHLPLDTDAFDALYLSKAVAKACSAPKPLVLPLIPYGVSYHHEDFSGTLSISPRTLSQMVYEVGMSVAANGITKLVVINGHGGNIPALQFAAQLINRDARIFTCIETGETSAKDISEMTETPNDVHAGEVETSTTLAVRPYMVRKGKAKRFIPRFSIRYLNFSSKRSVEWYSRTVKISPSGVMGDPTKASRKKGEMMWELMIKHLVEFIESLKSMSLDEIFQKRF